MKEILVYVHIPGIQRPLYLFKVNNETSIDNSASGVNCPIIFNVLILKEKLEIG